MLNLRRFLAPSLLLLVLYAEAALAQKFLPDDPLGVDRDDAPVRKPGAVELVTAYDVIEHSLFHRPHGSVPPAQNVNTLGEVPDSSWFTNRMGMKSLSIEELTRGPNQGDGPDLSQPLRVTSGKSGGITPGFTARDARGEVWFVKFDPAAYTGLSTGAEVIGTKFFHAFGYNVPENHIVFLRPELIEIDPGASVSGGGQKKRPMTATDLDRILSNAAVAPDGRVRAVASRRLTGEPLGPHKYHGTRGDDANDVFPHEHRRELRGYRVFCAWLNHDDSRSINSIDMYVGDGARRYVKHYLLDFSSSLGSGSDPERRIAPQNPRAGNEYVLALQPLLKTGALLGLWERPWRKVRYNVFPEVGRIEADYFEPQRWKPEYPNPAFERMLPQDAFWATRIVSRFSDEAVRAIVHIGQFRDPAAERHLADTLLRRRDKIVAHYFRQLNPLDAFSVDGDAMAFRNVGAEAGLGSVLGYDYQWFAFDNASKHMEALAPMQRAETARLPLPRNENEYAVVRIRTQSHDVPAWAKSVDVYVKNTGSPRIVGIERED